MRDFWRAFALAKNQWGRRVIVGIAMAIDTATLILIPLLMGNVFDYLTNALEAQEVIARLNRGVILLITMAVVRFIVIYLEIYFQEGTGNYISHDIREMLFHTILKLPFSFFDRKKTGDLMSVMTKDVDAVRDGAGFVIMLVIVNAMTAIGISITMFRLNALLALIVLSLFPFLGLVSYWYSQRIRPMYEEIQQRSGKLHTVAQENTSGIRVVKAFCRQQEEQVKFGHENTALYHTSLQVAYLNSLVHPCLEFLGTAAGLLALGAGGVFVIRGDMTLGTLVAFTGFTEFMVWPIRQIGWLAELMQKAIAGANRIYQIIDEPKSLEAAEKPASTRANGEVVFDDVSFSYQNGEEALKNFSLKIKAGQKVCLLGMTGSGKTTVANLLPRFYSPTEGKVTIDGIDIAHCDAASLRSQIGFVFQDNFLFSASVWDNLTMGHPVKREKVMEAIQAAQASSFINRLPAGLETVIGERGIGLSGGERQRVAIARALLRDPSILIFDDSTASLDMRTEASLKKALDQLFHGRTVLIIAQRVSTAMSADHIVLLDNGEIAEQGTHQELLALDGIYAQLNQIQNTNMRLTTDNEEVISVG